MERKNITISVNKNAVDYLKPLGINISFICRNFLDSYIAEIKRTKENEVLPIFYSKETEKDE